MLIVIIQFCFVDFKTTKDVAITGTNGRIDKLTDAGYPI